jgi:hypothetical protein
MMLRVVSSEEERFLDTEEVTGSIPVPPTKIPGTPRRGAFFFSFPPYSLIIATYSTRRGGLF